MIVGNHRRALSAEQRPSAKMIGAGELGIKPSYSRPRVSDDNAFGEALFRTVKYQPEFPLKGFADLDAARQWARRVAQGYNHEHRHSGIRYVTPAQPSCGAGLPPCSPPAARSTRMRCNVTSNAGAGRPVTGHRLAPSPSIRSAMRSPGRQRPKSCFPVSIDEPAFPSRPDSAQATERKARDGRSGATRSAPLSRASFSAVSTAAHSSPVVGSQLGTSAPPAQRPHR